MCASTKLPLLREAARNFLERAPGNAQARFEHFCADNDWWLEDFVLFDALRDRHCSQKAKLDTREGPTRDARALRTASTASGSGGQVAGPLIQVAPLLTIA